MTALPTREQLHAWLAEVHRDSRVLSRLPARPQDPGLDQLLRALLGAAGGGAGL
jgi:hypothetical protein